METSELKSTNERLGLTEIYQHDIDEATQACKKCNTKVEKLLGGLKLCPVIGSAEVAQFRDYEER